MLRKCAAKNQRTHRMSGAQDKHAADPAPGALLRYDIEEIDNGDRNAARNRFEAVMRCVARDRGDLSSACFKPPERVVMISVELFPRSLIAVASQVGDGLF